ncbi:MAG: M3 family metallopeptidase [Firmicutes bacterium]|nr:M3 family metallopeptidase [Bacillota bacterium]MCM1402163.1 M3 family metallopeptidase [Bacteroides sp.]MCM1476522.1 M3 family metallopeptidase [Bacteroides sp.]
MTSFAAAPAQGHTNPFLEPYNTPYNIPPFEKITYADYLPALEQGIKEYKADIDAIVRNRATPDFNNTILAMEQAGNLLNRVMTVFSALDETESCPEMVAISEKAYPMYSQVQDEVMMNPELFNRVKQVYDRRKQLGLNPQQLRAVEQTYKRFTRNGALLPEKDKERLKALNTELTDLYLVFNKNLLNDTNAFQLWVSDSSKLAGLPASSVAQAKDAAVAAGKPDQWLFTLHAPSRLPLLQYADNRNLRRQMYEGYINLASSGKNDNKPVINRILKARSEKARLLGFDNFASYATDNVMAKTPEAAENLLLEIWQPAVNRVADEVKEMQALANKRGDGITIEPWDYYYYAEKVRQDKYNLDEDEVRAYFSLDNVREGIFSMANRLYGITFTEMPDAPKYNPEVKVYNVTDKDGNHVAVFMTDYFPRASKRQGAWMSEFQGAFVDPDGKSQRPIVFNVGNFTKPSGDTPALLTLDEVETMFHEFGHGLHGMLTKANLRSQAGTNVDRDFVELPSQIHEHWALEPELLKTYARHYKTGEVIPDELIEKLQKASTHNQGFISTELVGAALLDLQYGKLNPTADVDITAFEKNVANTLGMPETVQFRYRSPYFRHVFGSDGYASGYYTYLWAEVLDSDGFELFKEKGIFDPATAKKFKELVLEAGGTADPMDLYVTFRGHRPSVDALLRNRGLTPVKKPAPKQTKIPEVGGK